MKVAMIEADGTPVENKVIRDFRITDIPSGWMKPGHGYWIVWVREIKDKESLAKVMPVWEEYVASGACTVSTISSDLLWQFMEMGVCQVSSGLTGFRPYRLLLTPEIAGNTFKML